MSSETLSWIVIGVLCVRSVYQQIYIKRLKKAMQNMVLALDRINGVRTSDRLRGEKPAEVEL